MGQITPNLRGGRRGGALTVALLFMILITVAGTALLSVSIIHRTTMVKNGIDVRLMIAAEAGVETLRGRFTLIQGVQDDWTWLNASSWTNVGTPNINGTLVTVEAMLVGGPSVPRARIRARASASDRTRVVEYLIKVATFSDYAVFTGANASLGKGYKAVGNVYTDGDITIGSSSTEAQMLGNVTLTGDINKSNGEPDSYTFPLFNPLENQPQIPFPTWVAPWQALEDVARAITPAGTYVYAENTLEIELGRGPLGPDPLWYRRVYVQRNLTGTGIGTVPKGTGWINRATGATSYSAGSNGLNNGSYTWAEEFVLIPDEGVIYVKSGKARLNGSGGAATPTKDVQAGGAGTNDYLQTRVTGNSGDDQIFYNNYAGSSTPTLLLSGTLTDRRVSIACDHKIIIKAPIKYQTLLDHPEYRRFWADGINGKESAGALGFKEMLGVMAKGDIHGAVSWWTSSMALPAASVVTDIAGEYIPGHYSNASDGGQFAQDGVYMSLGGTNPFRNLTGTPLGEMWFHGGLIAQGQYGSGNASTFKRRNYDWDYRMRLTCPPYFLRAYNTSAVFIPGTWRSYEL